MHFLHLFTSVKGREEESARIKSESPIATSLPLSLSLSTTFVSSALCLTSLQSSYYFSSLLLVPWIIYISSFFLLSMALLLSHESECIASMCAQRVTELFSIERAESSDFTAYPLEINSKKKVDRFKVQPSSLSTTREIRDFPSHSLLSRFFPLFHILDRRWHFLARYLPLNSLDFLYTSSYCNYCLYFRCYSCTRFQYLLQRLNAM